MVTRDLSSSAAYKRDIGWNEFIEKIHHQSILLHYTKRVYVLNACLCMYSYANTHLQITWRPCVSMFEVDKETDLIINLMWSVLYHFNSWIKHNIFFSELLAVIVLSFLWNAQLLCLSLCFSFICWSIQEQTCGFLFIAHFVRVLLTHLSVFNVASCPVDIWFHWDGLGLVIELHFLWTMNVTLLYCNRVWWVKRLGTLGVDNSTRLVPDCSELSGDTQPVSLRTLNKHNICIFICWVITTVLYLLVGFLMLNAFSLALNSRSLYYVCHVLTSLHCHYFPVINSLRQIDLQCSSFVSLTNDMIDKWTD